jgi:hypothetical protein
MTMTKSPLLSIIAAHKSSFLGDIADAVFRLPRVCFGNSAPNIFHEGLYHA